jgi:hypothetical protein
MLKKSMHLIETLSILDKNNLKKKHTINKNQMIID